MDHFWFNPGFLVLVVFNFHLHLQHAEGEVVGSSGRCISLLLAIKTLLNDSLQQLASAEDINKEVDSLLKPNLTFLKQVLCKTNHKLKN